MSVNLNNVGALAGLNLQNMDIESALAAVQSQRAQLLEDQLKGQLSSVSERNQQIATMNETLNGKRSELGTLEATLSAAQANPASVTNARISELTTMRDQLQQVLNRDPNGWTGLSWGWAGDNAAKSQEMLQRVQKEGLTNAGEAPKDIDKNGTMDAQGKTLQGWIDQLNSKISAEQTQVVNTLKEQQTSMKTEIDNLKTSIDSVSNSQQMEMLRLQSLTNKRNEAFDVMTNFIKKMQDSHSSILGNMR